MTADDATAGMVRRLPAVGTVLQHATISGLFDEWGRRVVTMWVQEALASARSECRAKRIERDRAEWLERVIGRVLARAEEVSAQRPGPVINATGIVLHTSLGRAPLSESARRAVQDACGATNLEIDLITGERRRRGDQLREVWQLLTGCEDALVVNNNAAATLLTLQALCGGGEVIISRGQLIEIGGSFRLPEIFALGGVTLREVGTTNRTRLTDYEAAITDETAAILRVHPSNYRVVGFAETPDVAALAELSHRHDLLCLDDIGSGSLRDLSPFGLSDEPTFPASIEAGADIVLGSGDKLLGGPQAGIILGRADLLSALKSHPLARCMRVDKLTLAALSATLEMWLRDPDGQEVPTIGLLTTGLDELRMRADRLCASLHELPELHARTREDVAEVGGGSLPGIEMPTMVVALRHDEWSAGELARYLRSGAIRVFPRIAQDEVLLDLRSVLPADDARVTLGVRLAVGRRGEG